MRRKNKDKDKETQQILTPELPTDVYQEILKHLNLKDSANLAKASTHTAKAARRQELWHGKLAKEFPHHYQRIARKLKEGATINFEKLYQEAYAEDYQGLNKRQKKLIELVKAGDLEGIKKYEPLKISDFYVDKHGKSLTLWAIYFHHDAILQYINNLKFFEHTPTDLAIFTHRDLENYENLQFSVNSGQTAAQANNLQALNMIAKTNPDLLDTTNPNYWTPLILAAAQGSTEAVQFLLKTGVNKHAIRDGYDALMWAIIRNQVDTAEVLISTDIDLRSVSSTELISAIHFAARYNCYEIVQMLLKKDPTLVNQLDTSGQSPLIFAASKGHTDIVNLLLKSVANVDHVATHPQFQWTALQSAVNHNHTETTIALLEAGADPSPYFPGSNYSPLHMAAQKGNIAIVKALLAEEPKLILTEDTYGKTPLYYAACHGHFEVEKLLLINSQPLPGTEKYKHQSFFWAQPGKCRDMLKLKNLRAKYLNKDFKEFKFFGKTIRFSAEDKRVAAEHLLETTLDNDKSKLSEKDKKVLEHAMEFKGIYKHLKSQGYLRE